MDWDKIIRQKGLQPVDGNNAHQGSMQDLSDNFDTGHSGSVSEDANCVWMPIKFYQFLVDYNIGKGSETFSTKITYPKSYHPLELVNILEDQVKRDFDCAVNITRVQELEEY